MALKPISSNELFRYYLNLVKCPAIAAIQVVISTGPACISSAVPFHIQIRNGLDNFRGASEFIVLFAAPVPGGCNMEFNTEIAPYAMVQTDDTMIIVDVQPASAPFNSVRPNCEKNVVTVEMYHRFLSSWDFSLDSYFSAIINMLTVTDIKENGVEVLQDFQLLFSCLFLFFSFFSLTISMKINCRFLVVLVFSL